MNITRTIAMLAVSLIVAFSLVVARARSQSADDDPNAVAVQRIVNDYSERMNRHDAHDVASLFAEDADFTNMRGDSHHGRKEIEAFYAKLFDGPLKEVYRTDTVKSIRILSPEIAAVDGLWQMRFTLAANGTRGPVRDGLFDYVLTKQNGRWFITIFHESEFAPPPADPAAK
ncbi:MAG: SgcJ/EcaC family oxidoreductase [Acidobacteriia bacterium]|nr:SgcJ/EcaC family oxidoreductase [Terriglobia bacterium]